MCLLFVLLLSSFLSSIFTQVLIILIIYILLLFQGMPLDTHHIQVPVIKQLNTDSGQNMILQNSIPSSHVIVNTSSTDPLHISNNHIPRVSTVCEPILNTPSTTSQDLSTLCHMEIDAATDLNVSCSLCFSHY